jgi:fyn-related kinase
MSFFTLSVRDGEYIKHYRIRTTDEGEYYIARRITFKDLPELVAHYSEAQDELCARLERAARREQPETWGLSHRTNVDWEIPRDSIKLRTKLGGGQFGDVWEGVWNGTTAVAVKAFQPGTISVEVVAEVLFVKTLRHPKLIQLYAVCTDGEPVYFVTELMKHGSMLDCLRDQRHALKLVQLLSIAAQIAEGMA